MKFVDVHILLLVYAHDADRHGQDINTNMRKKLHEAECNDDLTLVREGKHEGGEKRTTIYDADHWHVFDQGLEVTY
jgi:hypothetical protein